jgi:ABC-2 type transport system ATP-binding protein
MRVEHGMTIVLTTHYMDEADSMTERVVVVDQGQVIADDTAEALKAKLAGDRIAVTIADSANTEQLARLVRRLPSARDVTVTTGSAVLPNGTAVSPRTAAPARRTAAPAPVSILERGRGVSTVEARVDDGPGALPELIIAAYEAGIRVAGTQVFRPTLDDVFLNLTGRSLRENDESTKETKP